MPSLATKKYLTTELKRGHRNSSNKNPPGYLNEITTSEPIEKIYDIVMNHVE